MPRLLINVVIALLVTAIIGGIYVRVRHPDFVSARLTDLSRREDFRIRVAVPMPWSRPPLADLPRAGDKYVDYAGRDEARFVELASTSDTYPIVVFDVRARVDPEGRRWFDNGQIIPGAGFAFVTDTYRVDGMILTVVAARDVLPEGARPRTE